MEKPWYQSYAKGIPRHLEYERTPMPTALARTAREFPDSKRILSRFEACSGRSHTTPPYKIASKYNVAGVTG